MKNVNVIYVIFLVLSISLFNLKTDVTGQQTRLDIMGEPTTLNAGFNTTVVITIFNEFEPIYDVDVSVSFPQSQTTTISPVVIGASNWKFERIGMGENVTINPLIYVTESAAGNAYPADISISYTRLGYISPSSETHTIGFYAKGQIIMIIYDFIVEIEPVYEDNERTRDNVVPGDTGSTITVTGSLLNKGNVPAMFTNVTIIPNPILILQPESTSYLGEVDPNSPAPFTLETKTSPQAKDGNHTILIKIEYQDQESKTYSIEKELTVYIFKTQILESPSTSEKIIGIIRQNLLFVIIGMIIFILLVAILIKRLSKRGIESEEFPA
ncbi:hypothetical protein [[Eubacterium] cellulosolvens]